MSIQKPSQWVSKIKGNLLCMPEIYSVRIETIGKCKNNRNWNFEKKYKAR